MAKTVTIRISAEDNFSTVLQKYNSAVGGAAQKSGELDQKSRGAGGGITSLTGAIQTGLAVWGTLKMASFVGDVINLGRESNLSAQKFGALTRDIGGSQATLDELRSVTGGIVDNMTLMQGAGTLLQMNLAGNSDELARLTEMAIKLKSPSMDAAKAFNDFSLMLANQSIMRLDQFGISGAAVRREIEHLIKTGQAANREEAFKLAVLAEGEKALNRLGDAATAAETPIARLETRVSNLAQEFAGRVATGAEGVIGILEVTTNTHPVMVQRQETIAREAKAFADEWQVEWIQALGDAADSTVIPDDLFSDLGGEMGRALLEQIYTFTSEGLPLEDAIRKAGFVDAGQIQAVSAAYTEALQARDEQVAAVLEEGRAAEASRRWQERVFGIFRAPGELLKEGENFAEAILKAADDSGVLAQVEKEREAWAKRQQIAHEYFVSVLAEGRSFVSSINTALDTVPQRLVAMGQVGTVVRGLQADIAGAFGTAFMFRPGMMDMGALDAMQAGGIQDFQMPELPQFMTPEQASAIRDRFQEATLEVERLRGLADQGLINPEDLTRAEGLRDNLGLMANEADRAAEAFAKMRLSDVLGTGGGGMAGEITDLVIKQMEAAGATPEEIAAMQRALDLQSGRQTTASLAMQEQIAPRLAGMTPEQAALAQANLTAALQQAALLGISPDQLVNMQAMLGVGAGGQVISGMNPQLLAMLGAGQGMNTLQGGLGALWSMLGGTTPEGAAGTGGLMGGLATLLGGGEEGTGTGALNENLQTASDTLADLDTTAAGVEGKFTTMATNMAESLSSVQNIRDAFSDIEGVHEVTIKVNIEGADPAVLTALGIGTGASLETQVVNNGGRVPGTSPRVGRR